MKSQIIWPGLLMLCVGVAIGYFVGVWRMESLFLEGPAAMAGMVRERLSSELSIRREQRPEFESLWADTHHQLEEVRRSVEPRMEEVLAGSIGRAATFLDPAQVVKLKQLHVTLRQQVAEQEARAGVP